MRDLRFSLSLSSIGPLRLGDEAASLESAGCAELHMPVADGSFVPYFGFDARHVEAVKAASSLPVHVHAMVENPAAHLEKFLAAGADAATVHVESGGHLQSALTAIRESGASPGIAIAPHTPLTRLDYLLVDVDRIVLCAAEPGFPRGPIIASALERVRILRENLDYRRLPVRIQVWGPLEPIQAARHGAAGAAGVVLTLDPDADEYTEAGRRLAVFKETAEAEAPLA